MNLTKNEIQSFREKLKQIPEAQEVLDDIDYYDGDAIFVTLDYSNNLSSDRGIKPMENLQKLVSKFRHVICSKNFKDNLLGGVFPAAITALMHANATLQVAIALTITISKLGLDKFCKTD